MPFQKIGDDGLDAVVIVRLTTEEKDRLHHSFGAWVGPESAEEIIDTISSSRSFNRKVEKF